METTTGLPENNLSEYSHYLAKVLCNNTGDIQDATEKLETMSQNLTQFIDSFMMIILTEEETEEINMKTKSTACVILNSLLPRILEKQGSDVEKKKYIAKAILTTMYSPNVGLNLKVGLQVIMKTLYNLDTSSILCVQGLNLVKNKLTSDKISDYAASLLIFQAIINVPQISIQAIVEWFFDLRKPLIASGHSILQGLNSEMKDFVNQKSEEKMRDLSIGFRLLDFWIMIMQDLFRLLTKSFVESRLVQGYIEVFINDEALIQMFSSVLEMQSYSPTQIELCLLSTSNFSNFDDSLNQIKAKVLKIFNNFLGLIYKKKSAPDFSQTKLFTFFKNDGIKGVLNSLFLFCKSDLFTEKILAEKNIHDCILECLIFLTRLSGHNDFDEFYTEYMKQLVLDIILPLMQSTSRELKHFNEDPAEFVNFSIDTCSGQESQTLKTQSAQLLEYICDNIDGSVTYIIKLLADIIDFTICSESQTALPLFAHDINSKFMSQTNSKIRLETCLIALSTINYFLCSREDLITLMENLIMKHWNVLTCEGSDALIKSRLCLFIENYIDILFQDESQLEMWQAFLKFVLESIGMQGPEFGSLSEQAIETLVYILQQEELAFNLSKFLNDIFKQLIHYMKVIQSKRFYEILEEIQEHYNYHLRQNPDQLHGFLTGLVEKAQAEYELLKSQGKERSVVLMRIWTILRRISEDKLCMAKFQEDIEKVMMPLFSYFINEEKTSFQDDILKYLTSVIKISKKVSSTCWMLFQAFPKIIKRDETVSSLLFVALNQFIIYGRDIIDADPSALEVLINTILEMLTASEIESEGVEFCRGVLVLQFIIQYFDNLSNSDFEKIIKFSADALCQNLKKGYMRTKLEGVLLSAFLRRFGFTEAMLISKNMLEDVIRLLIQDIKYFDENLYERKLFVVGLSNFLQQSNVQNFANMIPQIINALVSILKYIQHTDSQKEKGENANAQKTHWQTFSNPELLQKFFSDETEEFLKKEEEKEREREKHSYYPSNDAEEESDDDNDDSDDDTDNSRESVDFSHMDFDNAEVNELINSIENGMKNKDEFTFFKQSLFSFKENHQIDTNQLLETLTEPKRVFLKDILASQRVVVDNDIGRTQTRKIVKPKARKIAPVNPDLNQE